MEHFPSTTLRENFYPILSIKVISKLSSFRILNHVLAIPTMELQVFLFHNCISSFIRIIFGSHGLIVLRPKNSKSITNHSKAPSWSQGLWEIEMFNLQLLQYSEFMNSKSYESNFKGLWKNCEFHEFHGLSSSFADWPDVCSWASAKGASGHKRILQPRLVQLKATMKNMKWLIQQIH